MGVLDRGATGVTGGHPYRESDGFGATQPQDPLAGVAGDGQRRSDPVEAGRNDNETGWTRERGVEGGGTIGRAVVLRTELGDRGDAERAGVDQAADVLTDGGYFAGHRTNLEKPC
jgi:hypothetical protein